ncbi:hypothetical protein [Micromonospora sp. C41]|uniref:hypothetical protein n=1 Tax=Micromonospora sp. C41 TaxID=2824878 RepID=UPI001B35AC13|nr:hypothetical protein [Micromonospora sp. C41]MBQ1064458.1 hypothetical protein [Micromonospora sp. C41]
MQLLSYTDPDGNTLTIDQGDDLIHITTNRSVTLNDEAVRLLTKALAGEQVSAGRIVAGREYRLLPDPQRASDTYARFLDGVTRVMALEGPRVSGDVLVMTIDDSDADGIGESGLVHQRYLA